MNLIQRVMYRSLIGTLRVVRRIACRPRVWGRGRIPYGPKIYVTNHISSTDPWYVLPVFTEPVHAIIGPGYKSGFMGWMFDRFEQINAMPEHRETVIDDAAAYLERGEPIWITPEGDIQPDGVLGPFFPGAARIYRRCLVPIVPIAMVAPRRAMRHWPIFDIHVDGQVFKGVFVVRDYFCINVGEPLLPELGRDADEAEDNMRIIREIRERVQELVNEVRAKKLWVE